MFHNAQAPLISRRRRGFTIVEIVIACIIIGILTLVMVPVLTNKANDARVSATKQELEHLANAEERACIETGYLYRPYVLNDVAGGDGIANAQDPKTVSPGMEDRIQGIRDNIITAGNVYLVPNKIFISPTTQDYLADSAQTIQFNRMVGSSSGSTTGTLGGWGGPYLNWKRDDNRNDWPEDPWGNDYMFFTKAGIIYPPDPTSTNTTLQTDTSSLFRDKGPEYNVGGSQFAFPAVGVFDRPTWLSLGPNGVPGSGTTTITDAGFGYGKGDDIKFSFGGN